MCAESGTSPLRMPQFIEAWDVDTIQDCNSSEWRFGPTPLHPKLSHGSHNPQSCVVHLAPSFVSLVVSPPQKKKLLPHGLEGGHAPWEPDGVYLQLVFRFGDTKKEFGPGLGLEGQKTKIPPESKGHSLYMCVCTDVSAHVHPFLPPLALVHIPGKIDCLPRIICPRHPTADPPVSLHLALWTPPQDPANHPILSEHPWHPLPLTLHTSLLPPLPPCRPPPLFGKTRKWETLCADSKMSRKSWVEAEIYVTGCILQTLSFENCPSNPHSCP